ncbi:hydantoinase/oxoprolinase family protein [Paenibacillus sp. PAMC21692]|uniref:hydantoinase/oxoprolinase family protein n=1 Tax=Paenibacillus sp. PAMC21692 TaxID=2762320 RepID=UPI00164DF97D|nr:hydantoinase/oxoprolinase family protein [Paenibacillus sp. PAMC21692]QNK60313.1 hydantoinase/oxoprolinase family protein [Paenibacillus sp. PAMC21692]
MSINTKGSTRKWMVGSDVGGTFTDITMLDRESGTVLTGKILTTPDDPSRAIFNGLEAMAVQYGLELHDVDTFIHGTTLITNTMIERKGAATGLITTEGYRDVIEIGNEMRFDVFDLFLKKIDPLVPRYLRREVSERIDSKGNVLLPFDGEDVRKAAALFKEQGITSVAVAFINSYRNPEHEKQAEQILYEEIPGVSVTLSSDVAPEIRELERFSTTIANAYVKPLLRTYIAKLEQGLAGYGTDASLNIVMSNGGLTDAETAAAYPIQLIESGPAAGVIAAAFHGRMAGENQIIAFDMGGTTAKMCLVRDGNPNRIYEFEAARQQRFKKGSGVLLRIPVMEMIEIGAGGGSIAHLDNMSMLKVGPESAGSIPGPACYGQGGDEPVVTDADLVLGYLDPDYFLGGDMKLNIDLATRAIEHKVAIPLGISVIEAAAGIHEIVNHNMVSAARIHIAEKGTDPRKFSLVATGGAGPVHAYGIARLLGLKRIICPPATGVASAAGMLVAPPMIELGRSYVSNLDTLDWSYLRRIFAEMRSKAINGLKMVGIQEAEIGMIHTAEMRFAGQGYEIAVTFPESMLIHEDATVLKQAFLKEYEAAFGHCPQSVSLECINFRLRAVAPEQVDKLNFNRYEPDADKALKGQRQVYFPELKAYTTTAVYDRYRLEPGAIVEGPAVIEERESTVVAGPRTKIRVDSHLNLLIDLY